MTTRIAEAIALTLKHARRYVHDHTDKQASDLDACVILFHAEAQVKLENSQN